MSAERRSAFGQAMRSLAVTPKAPANPLAELIPMTTVPNRSELQTALAELELARADCAELRSILAGMNHMAGDERGGYCICARSDGSAPDRQHASHCADARRCSPMLAECSRGSSGSAEDGQPLCALFRRRPRISSNASGQIVDRASR